MNTETIADLLDAYREQIRIATDTIEAASDVIEECKDDILAANIRIAELESKLDE